MQENKHEILLLLSKRVLQVEDDFNNARKWLSLQKEQRYNFEKQFREEIVFLGEEISSLQKDIRQLQEQLFHCIETLQITVRKNQIEVLEKHINRLGFEKLLTAEQVKKLLEISL